jgi:hypothetical protein
MDKIFKLVCDSNITVESTIKLSHSDYIIVKDNLMNITKEAEKKLSKDILDKIDHVGSYKMLLKLASRDTVNGKNIYTLCALCKLLCQLNMQIQTTIEYDE